MTDLPPLPEPAQPATPVFYPTNASTTVNPGPMWAPMWSREQMLAYAAAAVAAELEACAVMVEGLQGIQLTPHIADAIRARSTDAST